MTDYKKAREVIERLMEDKKGEQIPGGLATFWKYRITEEERPALQTALKALEIVPELVEACEDAFYNIDWQSPKEDEVYKKLKQALSKIEGGK